MNRRMICRVLGLILACEAVLLILPTVAGLCYGESVTHFLITMALSGALGFLLTRVKPYSDVIYAKDGFVMVSLGWVLMSMIGALPFVLSGDIPHYIDALFETVSGFTTTAWSPAQISVSPPGMMVRLPRTMALIIILGFSFRVFSGTPMTAEPSVTLNSRASTLPSASL